MRRINNDQKLPNPTGNPGLGQKCSIILFRLHATEYRHAFFHGVIESHAAIDQDTDAAAVFLGQPGAAGGHEEGDPVGIILDEVLDAPAERIVTGFEGLIDQDEFEIHRKQDRDRQAVALFVAALSDRLVHITPEFAELLHEVMSTMRVPVSYAIWPRSR